MAVLSLYSNACTYYLCKHLIWTTVRAFSTQSCSVGTGACFDSVLLFLGAAPCWHTGACTWFPALFAHLLILSFAEFGITDKAGVQRNVKGIRNVEMRTNWFSVLYCFPFFFLFSFFLVFVLFLKQGNPGQRSVRSLLLCVPLLTHSGWWEGAVGQSCAPMGHAQGSASMERGGKWHSNWFCCHLFFFLSLSLPPNLKQFGGIQRYLWRELKFSFNLWWDESPTTWFP